MRTRELTCDALIGAGNEVSTRVVDVPAIAKTSIGAVSMQSVTDQSCDRGPEPQGLVRSRLERAVETPPAARICLVIAPAGSGKTTLLTHIASASSSHVVWLHARPEGQSEEKLAARLRAGLESPGRDGASIDDLLASLRSARAPIIIIIDDVHEITGGNAEAAIARLLLEAPSLVRFVVAGRRPPTFDTTRLLASGEMIQLGGDDLRFRSWEVEELFRTVYREPLSPEAAALLSRRLGGWAAGMQLFHLSIKDRSRTEREASVAELTGRCKLIRSYLTRNVVDDLPSERRDFLLRTSVLGVLTPRLCDDLLGRFGSEQILQDLEREHFFTSSEDGQTYVYHQVFRSHLEVTLAEELSDADLSHLLQTAGGLLEAAGYVQASARAFAQASDWASVGRVIQQSSSLVALDVDWSWGDPMSATAVPDDPWLALACARRLFQRGSLADSAAAFRQVEQMFDDPEARERCVSERAMAQMLLPHDSAHVVLPRHRGTSSPRAELYDVLASIRAMTQRILPPGYEANEATAGSGVADGLRLLLSGSWDHAEQQMLRAATKGDPRSWERLAVGIVDAVLECRSPDGTDPTGELERVSLAADVGGYPWLARVARGVQASAVVVRDQQRWRLEGCRDLSESCRRDGDTWGELIITVGAAVAATRIGDDRASTTLLASAGALAQVLDAPVVQLWMRAVEEARRDARADGDSSGRWQRLALVAKDLGVEDFTAVRRVVRHVPPPPRAPEPLLPTGAGAVTVRCLGGFAIETSLGDVALTSLRPRARMLLMALALAHGRDVHRERLAGMLWPGVAASRAHHSLHVAVSSVRQVLAGSGLGSDTVQRRGDAYRLQIDGVSIDTVAFERLALQIVKDSHAHTAYPDVDRALAVLDLYRGDLLPELGYAEWAVAERDRMRQRAAGFAVEVARLCLRSSRHSSGVAAARRALELDPYQDPAWAVLAQLQEADGDATAAASTRARHRDMQQRLDMPDSPRRTPPDDAREPASGSARTR